MVNNRFVSKLLDKYAMTNPYGEDTIYNFLLSCHNTDTGCEGTKLAATDATTLYNVMQDGVITQGERAQLGFLSQDTIDAIAGDDGKKPLRHRANWFISGLTNAKFEKLLDYINCFRLYTPEASAQFFPVAETLLERLISGYRQSLQQRPILLEEEARLLREFRVLEHTIKSKDTYSGTCGDDENPETCAKYKVLYNQIRAIRDNPKFHPDSYYRYPLSALSSYLGNLKPAPKFFTTMVLNAVKQDTPDLDITETAIKGLVASGHTEAVSVLRGLMEKQPSNYEYGDMMLGVGNANADDIRKAVRALGRDGFLNLVWAFAAAPRPALETVTVEMLSKNGAVPGIFLEEVSELHDCRKVRDDTYRHCMEPIREIYYGRAYEIFECGNESDAAFDRCRSENDFRSNRLRAANREALNIISKALSKFSFTSLKAIVESHKNDASSSLAILELGRRFATTPGVIDILLIATNDSAFPKTADAAGAVATKIINGEIKIKDDVRDELIRRCDPNFYHERLGFFTTTGLLNIYKARGENDTISDSVKRLIASTDYVPPK